MLEHEENPNGLELRAYPNSTALAHARRRLASCVESWPECVEGDYDPACCRFPKSCSCTVYWPKHVTDEDLEPPDYSLGMGTAPTEPDRPPRPDRAAAAREVEALLRRVHDVTETADDVEFYVAGDGTEEGDAANVTAGELAALVVDAVLGQEETT